MGNFTGRGSYRSLNIVFATSRGSSCSFHAVTSFPGWRISSVVHFQLAVALVSLVLYFLLLTAQENDRMVCDVMRYLGCYAFEFQQCV